MNIIGSFILFIFSLILFILLLIRYVASVNNYDKSSNALIIILRIMIVIFLLFLILDVRLTWTSKYDKPSNISVVFDMSKSAKINLSTHELSIMEIKDKIDKWSNLNKIEISYYGLGNELYSFDDLRHDENGFIFDDLTNFSKLNDSNQLKNNENILLITDGRATTGQRLNEMNFEQFPPIYSVGIGTEDFEDDLSIHGINVLKDNVLDDSLIMNLIIKSKLYGDHETSINISNSENNIIYHNFLLLDKGDNIKELIIKLSKADLSSYNIIKIDAIKGESNMLNNKSPFLYNEMNEIRDILLISGALSSNTGLIKKHVKDASIHKINEYYRITKDYWNMDLHEIEYGKMELIVLDDFPIYKHDSSFYNSMIDSAINHEIPVILIQGPAMNMKSTEIISKKNNFFKAELQSVDKLNHINPNSIWAIRMDYNFD